MRASTNASWSADAIPVRLPHFHLRAGCLFFLISRHAYVALGDGEQAVWNAIDGHCCIRDLQARLGTSVDAILERLLELRVCVFVPAHFPQNRKKIVVIEPHMDDAAFSVGGTMWLRRHECEFTIVTIAGVSNTSSYQLRNREYFDVDTVSRLRQAESALVARLLGGRHLTLNLVEASLRYQREKWTLGWYERQRQAINEFRQHCSGPDEEAEWTAALEQAITELQPTELWMPLGVGLHTDHQLVRQAYLNLLRLKPHVLNACIVKLFQDVPYAGMYPAHTVSVVRALRAAGARLEEERVDISAAIVNKLDLLFVYGSQFKLEVLRPQVERCARCARGGAGKYGELLYRLAVPPVEKLDVLSCYPEREGIQRTAARLSLWLPRNRKADTIRIISARAVGRWSEDMQFLLRMFPETRFEVHLPYSCVAETDSLTSERIVVASIGARWRDWVTSAAKALLVVQHPLVLLPGRGRERYAACMDLFNLRRNAVFSPTMNDLVIALRVAASSEESQ